MKLVKIIFTITLLISTYQITLGQEIKPFEYEKLLIKNPKPNTFGKEKMGFLVASFRFYKRYISSQDGNSCTFHPSCSEYSTQAITQKGLFVGGMLTFDRLSRCNGLSPEKYKKDSKTNLLIDEVSGL